MNKEVTNAINNFNAFMSNFRTLPLYLNTITLVCVPDESGFDVVINGIKFFYVAAYAFDMIPTFAYCTIGIMREFYFESIKTAE